MTLQYNMRKGDPMYAPARDIFYLYPQIVEQIEKRCYEGPFEPLSKYLKEEGVTNDDIADTVRAYCLFLNSAHKNPEQSLEQCMEDCGWFKCPGPARIALMFYLGASMSGTFFSAVRDVVKRGEDPPFLPRLEAVADRTARYMNANSLARVWLKFKATWIKPFWAWMSRQRDD